ncbi:helix-turn-helix transcriptional regulator [Rhizobium sp. SYY.PMSO]|uniref:helix-turn-helix transcriptional regulator n=1 Tax=Rhizobium sp. SYY.PMSO TaxID=3382192 RepID=UPI00398FA2F9
MQREWDVDLIAQSFSDAAIGYKSWQSSLDAICESAGLAGATLIPLKGALSQLPTSANFSEAVDYYFRDGWHKRDVRFNGLATLRKTGLVTDFDCASEDEIKRSPYYQEWLAAFRLKWFAGVYIAGFEEEWVLSLQQAEAGDPFDHVQCTHLRRLSRSFSSCAALANALDFSRADAAMEAFAVSGKAVVLLNRHGDVTRTNIAAERLFDDELRIRDRRLVCLDRTSTKRLDLAIQIACTSPRESFSAPILIKRADQGPLFAFVSPARGISRDVLSSSQAYVILVDPHQRRTSSTLVLQSLFGLTRTEAAVAERLARGDTLRDLAGTMKISYETARSHLRRIFSKVEVNNQAHLMAVLMQLVIETNSHPIG